MGSEIIAMTMPTKRPRKQRPRCHNEKPYTVSKTNWKAPKKRYRIPNRMAEKIHRFRHIGSSAKRRIGRYMDRRTVCATDRCIFSIGAIHRSSPVSLRSFCALRLKSLLWSVHAEQHRAYLGGRSYTGWYVSGTRNTIEASKMPVQMRRT